jgi:hypothetical protein
MYLVSECTDVGTMLEQAAQAGAGNSISAINGTQPHMCHDGQRFNVRDVAHWIARDSQ